MITSIKKYLNKPVAFVECKTTRLYVSIAFGLFVFLFLYIFKPFGIADYPETAAIKCLGYGLVTFAVMIVNVFLLPPLFPKVFDINTFTVKNYIIISIWFLLSISAANWLYTSYLFGDENPISFLAFIGITLSVGIFPMLFVSYYMEKQQNAAHQQLANKANEQIQRSHNPSKKSQFTFHSDNKSEHLNIKITELICIKSDGNYCEFFFVNEEGLKKGLLRITLKSVAKLLEDEPNIIRTHRSYLVNLQRVKKVSSTARNLSLHFDYLDFTIPVSRTNEQLVTNAIRQMQ